jgi:integrase/recombinase XerD
MSHNYKSLELFLYDRYASSTAKIYSFYLEKFLTKNPDAANYNFAQIIDYLYTSKGKQKKNTKLPMLLSSIKCYYNYLLETGQRNTHPCRMLVQKIKKKSIQIQDLFTRKELEQILNSDPWASFLTIRNKLILSFYIYQGVLSSEIIELKICDIDFDRKKVKFKGRRSVTSRTLGLNDLQIRLLTEYLVTIRPKLNKFNREEVIITSRGGKATIDGLSSLFDVLKHMFPERKLNATTVRQSVISNLLNHHNYFLEDVQLFSGQKWPSTTERYKRRNIEDQRQKINMWHPMEKK